MGNEGLSNFVVTINIEKRFEAFHCPYCKQNFVLFDPNIRTIETNGGFIDWSLKPDYCPKCGKEL